jgi:RNA polymerase sigma-70 factor (ECF subfamily)
MDFSEIYKRYAGDVHRFAFYLSGNRTLAEDLTSETFVCALCVRSDLRMGTLKAYLFAITRNLYRDFRSSQRHTATDEELTEAEDQNPGPHFEIERRESYAKLLRTIQKLPESEREALLLSAAEDLKYEQIALILGCSVAAVKVRICRARVKLKWELETKELSWKK